MTRLGLLALALCMGACTQDFSISKTDGAIGDPNPPEIGTPERTDQVVQVTTPEVDVLWVIDNSCSMAEEQASLADNFTAFMEFFVDSGLDWHIGVVSTDTDGGQKGVLQGAAGLKYLDVDSPAPVQTFAAMATLGTNGSADERGRRAAHLALTEPKLSNANAGFYRENASLNVIVISDENDYSGANPTRNEFIQFLSTLKSDPEMVTFSAIVGPTNGCWTADAGTEYLAVVNAVGGIKESICIDDWVPVLEQLGIQAAGLKREFFLSEVPVEGTIEVWVEDGDYVYYGVDEDLIVDGATMGDLCESDLCFTFQYQPTRNSIEMNNFIPNPMATINIRYDLLSGFQPSAPAADDTAAP